MFKIETAATRATRASDDCYTAIKGMEGKFDADMNPVPSLKAYQRKGDPVTIGFGHTGKILVNGELRMPRMGDVITTDYAHELFLEDIQMAEDRVDRYFAKHDDGKPIMLTQGQRDALVSFCFNVRERSLNRNNNTWMRAYLGGTLTWELLVEYLPLYRNARTIFEEGLYRRRLLELCMFFGFPVLISLKIAWGAVLKRDRDTDEVTHKTDPLFILLKAESEAKSVQPVSPPEPPPPPPPAPAETAEPAEAPETPQEPQERQEPKKAPPPPPPPARPPARNEKTRKMTRKHIPYPKPPRPEAEKDQMTRPEFWSLNILIWGRILAGVGFIPAFFTPLVSDPNFLAAAGGFVVIYLGMGSRWWANRQASQKRKEKRRQATDTAMNALREQLERGIIDLDEYQAEVREMLEDRNV